MTGLKVCLRVPRAMADGPSEPMDQRSYTYIDGVPHVTRSRMGGKGTALTPGGEGVCGAAATVTLSHGRRPLGIQELIDCICAECYIIQAMQISARRRWKVAVSCSIRLAGDIERS